MVPEEELEVMVVLAEPEEPVVTEEVITKLDRMELAVPMVSAVKLVLVEETTVTTQESVEPEELVVQAELEELEVTVVTLDKLVALDKPEILVRQVQLEIQEPTELAVTVTVERLVKAVQVVVVVPEEELLDIT